MPSITLSIERELPCPCGALSNAPFPACPECDGTGVSWQEQLVTCEYSYSRGCRGARDSYGAPLEPDDPEECEIASVTDANGIEVELTAHELEAAEAAALDDVRERYNDALEARAEAREEARRGY